MSDAMAGSNGGPTRREVVRLLSAGSIYGLLAGCGIRRLEPGSCTVGHPVIDVHCHFFNASDVPVEGLVRNVFFGEGNPEVAFRRSGVEGERESNAFIVFIILLLIQFAPAAKDETPRLKRSAPLPSREETALRQTGALVRALFELEKLAVGARATQDFTAQRFRAPPDYPGLLEEFSARAGRVRSFGRDAAPLTEDEANAIASALREQNDTERYIAFALLFLDYREAIAREYVRLYGGGRCVSLATPSFLDLERWMPETPRARSPQEDQVAVMEALQVRLAKSIDGFHMHSFVGFDPLRDSQDGGRSLARVKRAIRDQGFIGVKLYPPMGFRAWGNDPDIQGALNGLYNWCRTEEVPIMAHAENSIGPGCGYGKNASPLFWRQLLTVNGQSYKDLRLNLAHFGGFDEALRPGKPPTDNSCKADYYEEPSWESIIGEIIRDDQRPNVYADLSFLSELVSPKHEGQSRPQVRSQLEQWIEEYDRDARHLLYGTDWSMMAVEANYNNYLSRISAELAGVGLTPDQQENVLWKNAARYLGLGPGGATRGRIAAYCRNSGLDADWLSAFDAA